VVVEVIGRQVGEDGDLVVEAVHALLVEGVGGDLHGAGRTALIDHAAEGPLQLDRSRCGEGRLVGLAPRAHLDGAEQARRAAEGVEQVVHEPRDGRLAVRARHADDSQRVRRVVVERRGRLGEGRPGVRDPDERRLGKPLGGLRQRLADHEPRAVLDRVGDKGVPVGRRPGHGHEGPAGLDLATVGRERRHLERLRRSRPGPHLCEQPLCGKPVPQGRPGHRKAARVGPGGRGRMDVVGRHGT
jgi:hypothetical protein